MRNLLQKLFVGCLGVSMLVACSAESVDAEMATLNASASTVEVQDLSMNDLVGTWNMHSMTSVAFEDTEAVPVDFDKNEAYTYDLLLENDCFDNMFFQFDIEGNVATQQARLYFDGTTGEFTCQTTKTYYAKYQISGNDLKVTFTVDGLQYTETKTISRFSEGGEEYLKVTLTKTEVSGAVYVANDPGNTVASGIQQIDMIYKKVL